MAMAMTMAKVLFPLNAPYKSTSRTSQRGTASRVQCRSISSRGTLFPRSHRISAVTSRRHAGNGNRPRAAIDSTGDQDIVGAEQGALEQQILAQTEVGETVARAEAKVRVAAAAASAAGFAVEVAKQQGASEEATEAVGKAADAVAEVALRAAEAVKRVKNNMTKLSAAAVIEHEEVIQREIEQERVKFSKQKLESDL